MKKENILVSIIVPIYGTEAYLPACIESICNQSYPHIQIILVDDKSPDRCPEICDIYARKDDRITVIHQENKGVSGARNTGIRYATGDYVMFVDSDDELLPEAVDILLRDIYKYDADIVSATIKTIDKNGKIVNSNEDGSCTVIQDDKPLLLLLNEDESTYSACAKIFKVDFIKNIYFEEGQNIGEDSFFVFQCYARKPILVLHNVSVYQQNIRYGSNSKSQFSDKFLSMLYFFEKKKEYVIALYPQYIEKINHMEVCVNLRLLDVLCSITDKKYKNLQKQCIQKVCRLHIYYAPINKHHRQLVWIVVHRLYPVYKMLVRLKYYK